MTDIRQPKRGSLAFRPRKRAESQVARVYWPDLKEKRILGFAGYKVGMTSVAYIEQKEGPNKGKEVVVGATVLEVPPIMVYGIRFYKNGNVLGDVLDEKAIEPLKMKKRSNKKIDDFKDFDEIRLLVYAQPDKTKIGKKHKEKFEIGLGGLPEEQLELAKSYLGKEIKASEVFKNGEFVDVIAVTKGKGWQGPIKRFGVSKQRPKATGKVRHVGTLGQWHPNYVLYTVPQAGQMGYHKRTELNKHILKISDKTEEINPKGGFLRYGLVNNEYIILKGSVPGPAKRLIKLRLAARSPKQMEVKLTHVSLDSKQ